MSILLNKPHYHTNKTTGGCGRTYGCVFLCVEGRPIFWSELGYKD